MSKHVAQSQPFAHLMVKSVDELERMCGQTVVPHPRRHATKAQVEQDERERRSQTFKAAVSKMVKSLPS